MIISSVHRAHEFFNREQGGGVSLHGGKLINVLVKGAGQQYLLASIMAGTRQPLVQIPALLLTTLET